MAIISTVLAFLAPVMFAPAKPAETYIPAQHSNPRSVDGLIAWLETKNPAEEYDWASNDHCLMAQYRSHLKLDGRGPGREYIMLNDFISPEVYRAVAMPTGSYMRTERYFTFGKALSRARRWKARYEA